jgi:two-component system response regulator YesN
MTDKTIQKDSLLPPKQDSVYRVLIADSDPLMRKTLTSIISKIEGFQVTHSIGTLQNVTAQFKRDNPDIVIIELSVPWLIGIDIAREILASDRNTAIYTISSYDYFEISQFALDINIAGHILKPVSPADIITMLKRHKQFFKVKPSPQLSFLSKIVEECTFDHFYYNLHSIANSLQEESGRNTQDINSKLLNIHTVLSDLTLSNKSSPFPVSQPGLLSIDRVVELCLFYIMNSVFVLKAIKKSERLLNVFNYLDKNIFLNIGLNNLVSKCFISQGHLSRNFKKCFNISVMEYIHIRKMILSKIYFLFTECTVSDVAEILGYNERSYFSKVFKKFEKMTIQQFRQINHRADIQAAIASADSQKFINEVFGLTLTY